MKLTLIRPIQTFFQIRDVNNIKEKSEEAKLSSFTPLTKRENHAISSSMTAHS